MDALADMTLSSGPDAAWVTSRIQSARDAARRGLDEGRSGLDIVNALTAAVEASIRQAPSYHFAQANIGSSSGFGVRATGSFGPRGLAPFSDLALLFLCE